MFSKVLIAVDVALPQDTTANLSAAAKLTQGWDAELHAVTVIPDVGMAIVGSYFSQDFETEGHKAAMEQLTTSLSEANLTATPHVEIGKAYDRVLQLSKTLSADLIMIGAHQPDLSDYLLGSNASRVVRHSKQSVLVLRNQ
ncbi:MAG: universal stress protein [Pseudomonadota bacterium]